MKHIINTSSVLLILLSLSTVSIKAQPSESGYPAALMYNLPTIDLPILNLPYFNNEELKAADTCESCGKAFGIDALAEFDFWQESQMQIISNSYKKFRFLAL